MISGVLVVDKPSGPTSHDVVAAARRRLKTREIGHAGTLDPMATGVLVLAIGEGTKLVPYLSAAEKAYEATVTLGVGTDTLDARGTPTARAPVPADLATRVEAALDGERRRTAQMPPAYSAIHADGERAHAKARRGEEVSLAPREVSVRALDLVALGESAIDLYVVVSKGYYVRALARDLALALGTVGHLSRLRRTRSSPFDVAEACAPDAPDLASRVIPLAAAATRALPCVTLSDEGVRRARVGQPVPIEALDRVLSDPCAWLDARGALVAIGRIEGGVGRVVRGFCG